MELASLAQLERSHRRHDEVMAELLDAARRFAAGRPEDKDLARVHDAVAYFERAVARHFVDEEGSVFPRLSTRRPDLAAALAKLSAEHPAQIAMHASVAKAAQQLDGTARPSAGKLLLDAATKLAEAHRSHVVREDEIFASAHEALTAEDDEEIVAEMETRRGREGGGGGGGGRGMRRGGGGGGGGGGGRGGGGGGGGAASDGRDRSRSAAQPTERRKPAVDASANTPRSTRIATAKSTVATPATKPARARKANQVKRGTGKRR